MAYVPITITTSTVEDATFRNFLRLVDEYQVANSYIVVQDDETAINSNYPRYNLFIPSIPQSSRNMRGNQQKRTALFRVDFDVLPTAGWKKAAEMRDALEAGIVSENNNLHTARLRYLGSRTVSNDPIDINGQQILSKAVEFEFEVLL